MKKKKVQTDRNEILKICARFKQNCTVLHSKTNPSLENTSPDSSEVPPIRASEVKKTLTEMKNKAPGIDNLTSDIMILGGEESVKQLTQIFIEILETKKIPVECKEAKTIILHKKGDMRDIKRMEKILDENQPREQAGFRKGYSTVDHLQTINQLIERCTDFKRPLYIGYIVYEKAFDAI